MTGVVQNSWKFDIDKLKSELQHVLEDNVETGGEGSLTGIALTSKTGDIFNGFEYNLNIMYPPYAAQTRTNTYPEIYFNLDECRRSGVYHMLDYDVPTDAEDYVHRIGRTARAKSKGMAITFICQEDMYRFVRIEELIERKLDKKHPPEHIGNGPEWDASAKKSRYSSGGRGGRPQSGGGKGGSHRGNRRQAAQALTF